MRLTYSRNPSLASQKRHQPNFKRPCTRSQNGSLLTRSTSPLDLLNLLFKVWLHGYTNPLWNGLCTLTAGSAMKSRSLRTNMRLLRLSWAVNVLSDRHISYGRSLVLKKRMLDVFLTPVYCFTRLFSCLFQLFICSLDFTMLLCLQLDGYCYCLNPVIDLDTTEMSSTCLHDYDYSRMLRLGKYTTGNDDPCVLYSLDKAIRRTILLVAVEAVVSAGAIVAFTLFLTGEGPCKDNDRPSGSSSSCRHLSSESPPNIVLGVASSVEDTQSLILSVHCWPARSSELHNVTISGRRLPKYGRSTNHFSKSTRGAAYITGTIPIIPLVSLPSPSPPHYHNPSTTDLALYATHTISVMLLTQIILTSVLFLLGAFSDTIQFAPALYSFEQTASCVIINLPFIPFALDTVQTLLGQGPRATQQLRLTCNSLVDGQNSKQLLWSFTAFSNDFKDTKLYDIHSAVGANPAASVDLTPSLSRAPMSPASPAQVPTAPSLSPIPEPTIPVSNVRESVHNQTHVIREVEFHQFSFVITQRDCIVSAITAIVVTLLHALVYLSHAWSTRVSVPQPEEYDEDFVPEAAIMVRHIIKSPPSSFSNMSIARPLGRLSPAEIRIRPSGSRR